MGVARRSPGKRLRKTCLARVTHDPDCQDDDGNNTFLGVVKSDSENSAGRINIGTVVLVVGKLSEFNDAYNTAHPAWIILSAEGMLGWLYDKELTPL